DTTSTITAGTASCSSGSVCSFSLSASGTPVIPSFNFMATSSGQQGIGIDFNLKNAISLSSSGALSVNFNPSSPSPAVLSAFTLPRSNSNLSGSQLDLIEDFTGVVGLNGSAVTLTSPTRGTLTASAVSATNSLIGGLKTGDLLTVNIPASTVRPFLVDTKGLAVPAASLGLFQGQTDTSAIHPGQAIAIHVTAFTAASGTTIASATADTVT